MHNCFPIRPRPKNAESVKGFVLRIANQNGLSSHKAVFTSIKYPFKHRALQVENEGFYEFVAALAPYLQLDEDTLITAFRDSQVLDVDDKRIIKKIVVDKPKICITCLHQPDGYLRHHWQLIHNTHCEIHNVQLTDQCPNCEEPLNWHADLFDGCACCGLRWLDYSPVPNKSLPLYQLMVKRLSGNLLRQYLIGLYQGMKFAGEPQKLMTDIVTASNFSSGEIPSLLEKGYWLLSSKLEAENAVETIMEQMVKQLQFFDRKMIDTLTHPILTLPSMFLPQPESKSVITLSADKNGWLSDEQVSKLLGITTAEFREIAIANSIKSFRIHLMTVYEIDEIDNFMHTILVEAVSLLTTPEQDFVCIAKLAKLSHKFLFNFGEALQLLINSDINLYCLPKPKTLKDVFVKGSCLLQILQDNEKKQFTRLLSMTELEKYFGIRDIKIRVIADLFEWEKVSVNRKNVQYHPRKVAIFSEKYLVLDKYCDHRVYAQSALSRYLRDHNILPIKSNKDDKIKLDIFKKSKKLFTTIAQFEKDWEKSKKPYEINQYRQKVESDVTTDSANQTFFLTMPAIT